MFFPAGILSLTYRLKMPFFVLLIFLHKPYKGWHSAKTGLALPSMRRGGETGPERGPQEQSCPKLEEPARKHSTFPGLGTLGKPL